MDHEEERLELLRRIAESTKRKEKRPSAPAVIAHKVSWHLNWLLIVSFALMIIG